MASLVRSVDASTVFVRRAFDEDLKDRKLLPYLRSGLREGIGGVITPGYGVSRAIPRRSTYIEVTRNSTQIDSPKIGSRGAEIVLLRHCKSAVSFVRHADADTTRHATFGVIALK